MKPSTFKRKLTIKCQTKGPELEEILADVARHYKVDIELISKKYMRSDLVLCRRLYFYLAYKLTDAPLTVIGALVGKDHTNVSFHKDAVIEILKDGRDKWMDEWVCYLEDAPNVWTENEKIR
jgi:chromosomal replication initiation ATPase DnaA